MPDLTLLPLACALIPGSGAPALLACADEMASKAVLLTQDVAQDTRRSSRHPSWAVAGSSDARWLRLMADTSSSTAVLAAVAANRFTPRTALSRLASSASRPRVRARAIANASLPTQDAWAALMDDPLLISGWTGAEQVCFAGSVLRARPALIGYFVRHTLPAFRRAAARGPLDANSIERLLSPAHRGIAGRHALVTNPLVRSRATLPDWYPVHDDVRRQAARVLTGTGRLRSGVSPAASARIGSESVDVALADFAARGRMSTESAAAVMRAWTAREMEPEADVLADIIQAGGVKTLRAAARGISLPRLAAGRSRSLLLEAAWPLVCVENAAANEPAALEELDQLWSAARTARTLLRGREASWMLLGQLTGSGRDMRAMQAVEAAHDLCAERRDDR